MKRLSPVGCALLVCLAWLPAHAEGMRIYDHFQGNDIDPDKWITPPMCGPTAICAREVQNGHLRLAVRGYGAEEPPGEVTFAESQVLFAEPEAIETIRALFVVKGASARACPANPEEAAHPQMLVHGAFFNAGATGNPDEDVIAYLMVERRTDDPSLPATSLRVGGFMSTSIGFFNNVDLGTVRIGEPAVATLRWDRAAKAFVVRIVRTLTRPFVVEQTMHYGDVLPQARHNPAAEPFKSLRVGSFAPNCPTPSLAAMDARIDAVWVNTPSHP